MIASAHRPNGTAGRAPPDLGAVRRRPRIGTAPQESQKLLNWGFQNFDTVKLYAKGQAIATPEVWKGSQAERQDRLPQRRAGDGAEGRGAEDEAGAGTQGPAGRAAGPERPVGTLKMMVDGKPLLALPVVALEEVPQASIFGRAWDSMRSGCSEMIMCTEELFMPTHRSQRPRPRACPPRIATRGRPAPVPHRRRHVAHGRLEHDGRPAHRPDRAMPGDGRDLLRPRRHLRQLRRRRPVRRSAARHSPALRDRMQLVSKCGIKLLSPQAPRSTRSSITTPAPPTSSPRPRNRCASCTPTTSTCC